MKKLLTGCIVAAAALCAVGLAACTSTVSSSSLYSNWYRRTEYTGIQPAMTDENNQTAEEEVEELKYKISFTGGGNTNYEVSFDTDDAYMTTKFYATTYDWTKGFVWDDLSLFDDETWSAPSDVIPEDYIASASEIAYVYTTEFSLSGTYTYKATGEAKEFEDGMKSLCVFRSIRDTLRPVYSYQYTKTTSPNSYLPSSYEDMYGEFEYEFVTFYNYDCTQCSYTCHRIDTNEKYTDPEEGTRSADISDTDYAVYDNASIYTLLRSLDYYTTTSMYVDIFIPVEGRTSTYAVSGGVNSALLGVYDEDDETTDYEKDIANTILSALDGAGYIDKSAGDSIYYSYATLMYTGSLSGTTQTVWYASVQNTDTTNPEAGEGEYSDEDGKEYNTCRSVMLRISSPLPYSLGTLDYTLCEIVSSFSGV